MPSNTANQLIAEMTSVNAMTEAQLLTLRREFGADLAISADEADVIFALNTLATKPEGWTDYFVLMITTYLVHQGRPAGHINEAMASWLIARIDADGVVETETELRLLLNVLKVAERPGDRLESYALKQVREAVMTGRGEVGRNKLTPGVISKAEIELLRTVFYSVGSDGGMGISRLEAEEIFALNEETSGRDNDPEWQRFFVGAIANHLMMLAAPEAPSTAEALRLEKWLESDTSISGFWSGLSVTSIVKAMGKAFSRKSNSDDEMPQSFMLNEAGHKQSEKITMSEASWLVNAIQRDGQIDANERALLTFIREECPDIDASLRPLLDVA